MSSLGSKYSLGDHDVNEIFPTTTNAIDIPSPPFTQKATDMPNQDLDNPTGTISKLDKNPFQDEIEHLHEIFAKNIKEFYSNSGFETP